MAQDSGRPNQRVAYATSGLSLDEEAVASTSAVADDTTNLTRQIDSMHAQLAQSRDNQTVAQLADLLRRRFFCLGHRADIDEYLELHQMLPDIDLASFEPVVTSFHPELGTMEHRWVKWQPWLLTVGYELYPRYQPGWAPSWLDATRKLSIVLYSDHSRTFVRD